MSQRGDGRQRGGNLTQNRPGVKKRSPAREARREAVRQRAAERAAAARRRRMIIGGLLGVVVLAVVAVIVVTVVNAKPTAKATVSPTATAAANPTAGADGLPAAFATKPSVSKGTGDVTALKVTTLIKGTGAPVKAGQNVTVNYVGVTYKDGQEFDSSFGRSPFSFQIGQGSVIQGWDKGLLGVPVGSRVQLDIPSAMAYGDNAGSGPSGPLRFVVDVRAAA